MIYAFTANSSHLPCVDSADFVQEPEDTTVPSTRATSGQSDGVRKEARRGGSGCHISEVTSITYSGQAKLGERSCVCCMTFSVHFSLFVDGILRNTNQKKISKWRHQTFFANFFVLTKPKRLVFSNKRKRVNIGQNAFTLNQGDTPLLHYESTVSLSVSRVSYNLIYCSPLLGQIRFSDCLTLWNPQRDFKGQLLF